MRISDWSSDVCSSDLHGFGQLSCSVLDVKGDLAELRFQGDAETQDAMFQDLLARLGDDEGRRRYLRRSVLWPGTLSCRGGQFVCTILNMSLGGAKVALSDARHVEEDRKSTRLNSSH